MPAIKCNFSQLLFRHTQTHPFRFCSSFTYDTLDSFLIVALFTPFNPISIALPLFMLITLAVFWVTTISTSQMCSIGFTTDNTHTHNVFITYYDSHIEIKTKCLHLPNSCERSLQTVNRSTIRQALIRMREQNKKKPKRNDEEKERNERKNCNDAERVT